MDTYDYKIIVSGRQVETYEYLDKPVICNYLQKPSFLRSFRHVFKGHLIEEPKIAQSSLNRTRQSIRRIVNSNPQLEKFITLTHNTQEENLTKSNYQFNLFVQRMMYKFKDFQYLAVPEFQKNGRVHYHMLSNIRYTPSKDIEQVWGRGFIKINRIDRVSNVGAYVCKYMNKDTCDKRLFNQHKFLNSTNLKNPIVLTGFRGLQYFNNNFKDLIAENSKVFENKYLGSIQYNSYMCARSL